MYGGPLEFLFVVESKEDPACEVILQLMRDLKVCLCTHSHFFNISC